MPQEIILGLNQASAQASLRPLSVRAVAQGMLLSKYPLKSWRCGLWPHLAETTRCPVPFLREQAKKKQKKKTTPGSLSNNDLNSRLKHDHFLEKK